MGAFSRSERKTTRRAGFTLLEMIVALALASIVTAGVVSILGFMYKADSMMASQSDDAVDLAVTQELVRRSMQSLVSGRPLTDDELDEVTGSEEDENADEEPRDPDEPPSLEELRELLGGDAADTTANDDNNVAEDEFEDPLANPYIDTRPHFELYYVDSPAGPLPRLEIVLFQSPVPSQKLAWEDEDLGGLSLLLEDTALIRGVFELAEYEDGWALQWTPLEPPGASTVLIRRLEYVEWQVLPRRSQGSEWKSLHSAYLHEDYPIGVRLIIWTEAGTRVDWLFRTEVIPGGEA
ncbi:MAG: prepilin-type N-terminal cleavage/methylation domain-containing protein [Phycisphaerales bacterium]